MPNNWTHSPYVIDSVENKAILAIIDYMEWHPVAADQDLLIKNEHGKVLWQIRSQGIAVNHESDGIEKMPYLEGTIVHAINIVTIDAGTLYIYTH